MTDEKWSLSNQPIKSNKGSHLLKCAETNVKKCNYGKIMVNMTPKETNKDPITYHKEMKNYKLSNIEFLIILFKYFSELQ